MTGQNKQRQQQKEEKPDHTPHEVLQTLFAGVSPKQSVGHVCCFLLADPLLAFLISFLLFLFHPKWTQRFAFCPEAVPCCKEVCDRARVEGTPSQLIYCSSHCSIPCSARECQQSLEGLPPLSLWGWSFSHHSTPPPTHTHIQTHTSAPSHCATCGFHWRAQSTEAQISFLFFVAVFPSLSLVMWSALCVGVCVCFCR